MCPWPKQNFRNAYLKLSYFLIFLLSYIYCQVVFFFSYLRTDVGKICVSGILNAQLLIH